MTINLLYLISSMLVGIYVKLPLSGEPRIVGNADQLVPGKLFRTVFVILHYIKV